MEPAAASLIVQIETAFAGVRPGKIGIHQAEALDGYASKDEQEAARRLDCDTDWRDVPDAVIARSTAAFSFCDPEGWRFYLPAYMRFVLRHPRSTSPALDLVLSTLTMGWDASELGRSGDAFVVDEASRAFRLERYGTLTPAQVRAVRDFLRYLAEHEDEARAREARVALGIYWEQAAQR